MSNRKLESINGSSNPVLAKNECVDAVVSKFADSEPRIEIEVSLTCGKIKLESIRTKLVNASNCENK